MAIIIGSMTGIFGLTGVNGVVFYIVAHFIVSLLLLKTMEFNPKTYLGDHISTLSFLPDGLTGQAVTFILFWTLSYGVVHLFSD